MVQWLENRPAKYGRPWVRFLTWERFRVMEQLSPYTTAEPVSCNYWKPRLLEHCALQQEKPLQGEAFAQLEKGSLLTATESSSTAKIQHSQSKINNKNFKKYVAPFRIKVVVAATKLGETSKRKGREEGQEQGSSRCNT